MTTVRYGAASRVRLVGLGSAGRSGHSAEQRHVPRDLGFVFRRVQPAALVSQLIEEIRQ